MLQWAGGATAADNSSLSVSGSYRALFTAARAQDDGTEAGSLLANRLRLRLGGQLTPAWSFQLDHDTELSLGERNAIDQAAAHTDAGQGQALGGPSTWWRRPHLLGTQQVFRAYGQYSASELTLRLGRQRIALGQGRFWSTLDMLNPMNPQQIERDELVGVDAVFAEHTLGPLSKASLVYAPDPEPSQANGHDRWVAQYRNHWLSTDTTLTLATYWKDKLLGLDLATQWGGTGVRAEFTVTDAKRGAPYRSLLLGLDQAFSNTLTLMGELYLSDQRSDERAAQRLANPQRAAVQPLARRYVGVALSYEISPLLKVQASVLANLDDHSRLVVPTLTWSLSDNSVLMGGLQLFSGNPAGEYGRPADLLFLRYQHFF